MASALLNPVTTISFECGAVQRPPGAAGVTPIAADTECCRQGRHDFTMFDVSSLVYQMIIDAYGATCYRGLPLQRRCAGSVSAWLKKTSRCIMIRTQSLLLYAS